MEKIILKQFWKKNKKLGWPSGRGDNFKLKTIRSRLRKIMENGCQEKQFLGFTTNDDKESHYPS